MRYAFRDLQAMPAKNELARRFEEEVVEIGAVMPPAATQFENVAEALRCDQTCEGAFALDHHVGGNRRAVADEVDRAGLGVAATKWCEGRSGRPGSRPWVWPAPWPTRPHRIPNPLARRR
jgi:hypothetical protein